MRLIHEDGSASGLERSHPCHNGIDTYPKPYTAEQFFADVGVMLISLLALALVIHLALQ